MKIMNELPGNVRANIMNILESDNLESVHIGYATPLEHDDIYFAAIAREHDPKTPNCYLLYIYDRKFDKLVYFDGELTYADALIRMGEYIND